MLLHDKFLALACSPFYTKKQSLHQASDSILATVPSLTWFIIFVSSATSACAQLLKVTMLLSQCAIVPSNDMIPCWRMAGLMRLQNLENWSFESLPCLRSSISLKASTMGASARSCSSRFQRSRICSGELFGLSHACAQYVLSLQANCIDKDKTGMVPTHFASKQHCVSLLDNVQELLMLRPVCLHVLDQGKVWHSISGECML